MNRLRLTFFGKFRAHLNGIPIEDFVTDKVRSLLAWLASHPDQDLPRELIATLFWEEQPRSAALRNLRLTLHRLRQTIDKTEDGFSKHLLTVSRQTLRLNGNLLESDLQDFEARRTDYIEHSHPSLHECEICLPRQTEAMALYTGHFLADLNDIDSRAFEQWRLDQYQKWHRKTQELALDLAASLEKQGEAQEAEAVFGRFLELDPLSEQAMRGLLHLLNRQNKSAEIEKRYELYLANLKPDGLTQPDHETERLVQSLRKKQLVEAQTEQNAEHAQKPLPRSSSVQFAQLPKPWTPFIGRDQVCEKIQELLKDSNCQLLTLTGIGGIGKTRIALETARRIEPRFSDGVMSTSLVGQQTWSAITTSVIKGLGLTLGPLGRPEEQLIEFLRGKNVLIVLDNYDSAEPPPGWLSDLLTSTPETKFLITSRGPLHHQAEWLFEVPGLDLSPNEVDFNQSDAIKIFLSSATRANGAFELQATDAEHVLKICDRVGGLPLAIELAAAWTNVLTCEEIVSEIESNLDTLSNDALNQFDHQGGIRAVFNQSWSHLTPKDQQALIRLTLFETTFDREAMRQISQTGLAQLYALSQSSLLQRVVIGDQSRYRLHPLIKRFAIEKAADHQYSTEDVQSAYADYYLSFLGARDVLAGQDRDTALAEVELEFENIRGAWHRASDNKQFGLLQNSLHCLFTYLARLGQNREGYELFHYAVNQLPSPLELEPEEQSEDYNSALGGVYARYAWFCQRMGHLIEGEDIGQQSVDLFSGLQEKVPTEEAVVSYMLATIFWYRGEFNAAESLCKSCLAITTEHNLVHFTSLATHTFAVITLSQGKLQQSADLIDRAEKLFKKNKDVRGLALVKEHRCRIAYAEKDFETAIYWEQLGTAASEELGDPIMKLKINTLKGDIALAKNQVEPANTIYLHSLELGKGMSDDDQTADGLAQRWQLAVVHNSLGRLSTAQGEWEKAKNHFTRSLRLSWSLDTPPVVLDTFAGYAELLQKQQPEPHKLATELTDLTFTHPSTEFVTKNWLTQAINHNQLKSTGENISAGGLNQRVTTCVEQILGL